ncbi:lasso peptide biosynthesis B2 protein [Marivita geojedonensis]|uniref:lasso peptide biosynthesis B2 protein n=1 Tax=Marivita geojedonensis TaxID=1123756 RepID=UPI000A1E3AB7|nr:lasso peptide biosynthesis B2 protein [Marivita geojedonensis]
MMTATRRFLRTPRHRKALLIEAAAALLLGRFLTLFPMRLHTRVLGLPMRETSLFLPIAQIGVAMRVSSAVQRASMVVPFKAVCIEQTLATRLLLKRRGIPTTAYFGVHRDAEKRTSDPDGFNAHAWLRAGERVIIGGPDVSEYLPLAKFA